MSLKKTLDALPVRIILALDRPRYKLEIMKIASYAYGSFAYLSNILKEFEEEGIVKINRSGRRTYCELTEKGKRIREHLLEIKRLVGEGFEGQVQEK